jgi:hypothetical protein
MHTSHTQVPGSGAAAKGISRPRVSDKDKEESYEQKATRPKKAAVVPTSASYTHDTRKGTPSHVSEMSMKKGKEPGVCWQAQTPQGQINWTISMPISCWKIRCVMEPDSLSPLALLQCRRSLI